MSLQSDSDDEFREDFFGSVHSSEGAKKVSNSTQQPTVVFSKPNISSFVTDGGPYESKVDTTQIRLGTVRPSFPDEGLAASAIFFPACFLQMRDVLAPSKLTYESQMLNGTFRKENNIKAEISKAFLFSKK